jgi:hypothetical protein
MNMKVNGTYHKFFPYLEGLGALPFCIHSFGAFRVSEYLGKPLSESLWNAITSRLHCKRLQVIDLETSKRYNVDELGYPETMTIVVDDDLRVADLIYQSFYQ